MQNTRIYSNEIVLATSQLGFRIDSPKTLTLMPGNKTEELPETIDFYIQSIGDRKKRQQKISHGWDPTIFRWPFDISKGIYENSSENYLSFHPQPAYKGVLKKINTSWGVFWQADFSEFNKIGIYQIECEFAFTTPFTIDVNPYERITRSYLNFIFNQRSGFEVPAIHAALHLDDAVLDSDGKQINAQGGWYDAGDYRKWVFLTINNIEALTYIAKKSHPEFKKRAIDEIRWGNKFFHAMINEDGQVYEDVGAGDLRGGATYEDGWWNENHPGVIATSSGNIITDNIPNSGDERKVRTHYNPWCQYGFIVNEVLVSEVLPIEESKKCLLLAEKAWLYGKTHPHDERTLFISIQLRAALELYSSGSKLISADEISVLCKQLFERQDFGSEGLSHYFLEKNNTDGFRSIAFSCDPAMALLRLCEVNIEGIKNITLEAKERLQKHIENYLISDSHSNPFSVTPYGIYIQPPFQEEQLFRDAGRERMVRTFIHPISYQGMVHGTNSVIMHQAYLLARAGKLFHKKIYSQHAEKLIQFVTGHNPYGLSCFMGIGFKHPVSVSFVNYQIPDATIIGFVGREDDTPYMETSNAVEWSTQEIWDVPFYYAVSAIMNLE